MSKGPQSGSLEFVIYNHKNTPYSSFSNPKQCWGSGWRLWMKAEQMVKFQKLGQNPNFCQDVSKLTLPSMILYLGFLRTIITESPLRNILLMNLSLLTGRAFFLPLPVFGTYIPNQEIISTSSINCNENSYKRKRKETNLSPHLPDIFKNHVAVTIEGSHSA